MSKIKLLTESQITQVFERFRLNNPEPKTELIAPNPYCLLVSVVLSAQATDKSVNAACAPLYEKVRTPEQMLELGEEKLISYIKSIGLYRAKARHVMELSKRLVQDFNSTLPSTREELESLPGVGRKTANVILNVVFKQPTMPVDTHLLRICPKIGLAEGNNPLQVEKSLLERIPSRYMEHAHHWLILHGRYVCTARNPKCEECIISDLCAHNF
ncbi:endonuclease III [Treponema sp.]|uniref:endonuclease III n=1 Tax=Treponema sp. TaxID=166 RepID=UPI003FD799D0